LAQQRHEAVPFVSAPTVWPFSSSGLHFYFRLMNFQSKHMGKKIPSMNQKLERLLV
jgi:hypothetical protein